MITEPESSSYFCFLCGVNFNIYHMPIMREFGRIFRSDALRMYIGMLCVSVAVITADLYRSYNSIAEFSALSKLTLSADLSCSR